MTDFFDNPAQRKQLAEAFRENARRHGNGDETLVFVSPTGEPSSLNSIANDVEQGTETGIAYYKAYLQMCEMAGETFEQSLVTVKNGPKQGI